MANIFATECGFYHGTKLLGNHEFDRNEHYPDLKDGDFYIKGNDLYRVIEQKRLYSYREDRFYIKYSVELVQEDFGGPNMEQF